MDVLLNIEVRDVIDFEQPHSAGFVMTDGFSTGVASLLYDGQAWRPGSETFNVLEAEGSIEALLNAGTVTLTYTYDPVVAPLPAAGWLLATGLGMLGWSRRKSSDL